MLQAVPVPPPDPVIVHVPDVQVISSPWMTLPPEAMVVIVVAFFAACALVLFPLMRAIGRRIEGRGQGADAALRADVEQLRARLAEIEGVHHRVMELEERLEFAERLLAQRRENARLPGAGGGGG